jgi:hypothetical protein
LNANPQSGRLIQQSKFNNQQFLPSRIHRMRFIPGAISLQ